MTLYGIIQEAQEGLRPILHIEAHGDETGFETSSGEVVTWLELRQWLEAINVASDLNLIVSLGACKGAWLLSVSGPPGRAPFACLFAPVETIGDRDVERAFSIFFEEVFHSLNFGNAIHRVSLALPKTPFNTALYSARQVFLRGYEAFSSTHFSIERLSARAQQFEHQIRRSTSDPRRYWLSFDLREHYLRTIERIHHETCRRMKEEYFACDLDRRNHLKFGLDEFPH